MPTSVKYELKNGTFTTDKRLDRVYELDWRSLDYLVGSQLIQEEVPIHKPRSYTWRVDKHLDQGQEGACVGFAFSHELAARPQVVKGLTNDVARLHYLEAQKIDPWPGGAYEGAYPHYEGTSVLAGAQIGMQRGFYQAFYWAINIQELAIGLAYDGPAILGLNWHRGMFYPDSNGFIHPVGNIEGGHAILAYKIKIVYKPNTWWRARTWQDVDFDQSYAVLWNSWGPDWGKNGTAKISLTDLGYLLDNQGDACFPRRTGKVSL